MTLESAIQAAKARAQERCPRCQHEKDLKPETIAMFPAHRIPHTCHGDLEVLGDVADEILDSINCICDGQDDINKIRAKIRKLLGSEKGKDGEG